VAAGPDPVVISATASVPAAALRPGRGASGRITVTNDGAAAIVVTEIAGGSSAGIGSCPAGAVTTASVASSTTGLTPFGAASPVLAPGGSADYEITATMAGDADAACAGATFQVDVEVTAVGA
jgi:hypothetical protein